MKKGTGTKVNISLTLDKKLVDRIDKVRGLIKRSSYIEDILKETLSK